MNNPDEEVMSQEEQEQEQEEQPKLRILKHKKKKPASEKRRKQLARARATKAKKAMQKRLMKEQEAQIQEEEQRQNNNQAIEDRLADLIQQKVELAFEQFLGAGSEDESDDASTAQAAPLPRTSAPTTTVVDYSYLFQQ